MREVFNILGWPFEMLTYCLHTYWEVTPEQNYMECNSKYAKVLLCFALNSEVLKAGTSQQDKDSKMLILL